ncbi:MAG: ankyrin repeat domain-containing protein [Planctomycetota bacterium]|nr:MAG: ankyrin repeat domain-containing protein [Planctomycetota bacterium]
MKLSLPLKLTIFVVLLFAAVIATCLLWTPVRILWNASCLHSNDAKERVKSVSWLLGKGRKGFDVLAGELEGGEKAAEFLAEHWEHVNTLVPKSMFKSFPLHLAARNKWNDVAMLLIDKGAEIDARDEDDWTPLFWAIREKNKDLVESLVRMKADINTKDEFGCAPLDWAQLLRHEAIADFIRANGGKTWKELRR